MTILRGVSGSGKSTYASATIDAVVVSRDSLRVALFGSDGQDYYQRPDLREREDIITGVHDASIREALSAGRNVIVDNTHTRASDVNRVAKIGWDCGANVEIVLFDVPQGVAQKRNQQRSQNGGRFVPPDVIAKQYNSLQKSKNYTLTPPVPIRPYTGTPGKPKAFMVDIDGTLAHMNGKRGPYDWARVGEDDLDLVVSNIVKVMGNEIYPIIMSGRDGSCYDETEDWLMNHDIYWQELFMRPAGDQRADNVVKAELFDTYIRDNYDVQFVIDDRWQVCRMWLQMGLKVLNVSGLDRGEF